MCSLFEQNDIPELTFQKDVFTFLLLLYPNTLAKNLLYSKNIVYLCLRIHLHNY